MNNLENKPTWTLSSRLLEESVLARRRVYDHGGHTPLDELRFPSGGRLLLKREDASPMHAYKWRGSFNKIAKLIDTTTVNELVAASAGNHAQGVALGASRFSLHATVFMPRPTPRMKVEAVRKLGGKFVETRLVGDTFDDALEEAKRYVEAAEGHFIHPFDDLEVMAGQATIADEIIMSGAGDIDTVFLQIGGGGMAAGVANWLRRFFPGLRIIGVEGVGQDSMRTAVREGQPVRLDAIDVFCDGTAVRCAGDLTWQLCRDLIDDFVTVSNSEVCAAMQFLWEQNRIIPEPSGAMGVAAWLAAGGERRLDSSLAIICGANMDFAQLSEVVRKAAIGSRTRRYVRFRISEAPGSLYQLVRSLRRSVNIIEFQYGQVDENFAYPVIGFDTDVISWEQLKTGWLRTNQRFEDVTGKPEVLSRFIPCDPKTMHDALFLEVEFPERAGALSDFLGRAGDLASICYFTYTFTGERVGRALLGFRFKQPENRDQLLDMLTQDCRPLRSFRKADLFIPDSNWRTDTVPPLRP